MKLSKISEIRRRELRQAAYEVLQTEGMAGATIEKVALKAGASKGIVLHYFKTKQQLFEHAMRHSNALLRDGVIRRMRLALSPDERLWAIIACSMSAGVLCRARLYVSVVVGALNTSEPRFRADHSLPASSASSMLACART